MILGAQAGYASGTMTTATGATLVGYNTEAANSLTNAGAIGVNAYVGASNSLILGGFVGNGNGASANTSVGIGTTSPVQSLHVQGTARISGSDGTATSIMGRDGDGDVSAITVGSGLSLSSGTLTTTGGAGWLLSGNGGTTAGTDFLGTTDEEDLVLKTDGTEWVRIIGETTNQGNVGIHTTTPIASLHVEDNDLTSSSNTAIYGYAHGGSVLGSTGKAVVGLSHRTRGDAGYGGYFTSTAEDPGPTSNYGIYGNANGGSG